MSILVDWEIENAILKNEIIIDPFISDQIQPNSLDIHLGDSFKALDWNMTIIDPEKPDTYSYENIPSQGKIGYYILYPHKFLLASSKEIITLPDNIAAELSGISSAARFGLSIHQTGGWIDAGFSGQITLELYNCEDVPIILRPGMRIGQLVFHRTAKARMPYNMKPGAKYMHQQGPIESRYSGGVA